MAEGLKRVATKAKPPSATCRRPSASGIVHAGNPDRALEALADPVVELLGAVAGLTPQQMMAGARALDDELESRE